MPWTNRPQRPVILACGDSITQGTGSTDLTGWRPAVDDAFRARVGVSLDWRGYTLCTGTRYGYMCGGAGRETGEVLAAMQVQVPAIRPTLVVLFVGTNDAQHRAAGTGTPPTEAQSGVNLGLMLTEAQNVGAAVVVVTSLPPSTDAAKDAALVSQNAVFASTVAGHAWAAHCATVNARTAITSIPSWQTAALDADGVHPNDTGYAALATVLTSGIQTAWGS